MNFSILNTIKGLHPGYVVGRELKKRGLKKGKYAISIGEYPQLLGEIINQKRKMNTALSLKIEKDFDIEEGLLMTLQTFYDIKQEKAKLPKRTPDLSKIRPIVFWDTTFDRIDWEKYEFFIINRIFVRGNEIEKEEITRFYGEDKIKFHISQNEKNVVL
jgi:plasmid maintenance system antidote protein VapI